MKKILETMLIVLLLLTGCGNNNASTKDIDFLTASEAWYHYDETSNEYEKIVFHDDFTFSWDCSDASNNYDQFNYDKETSIVHLYNDSDDQSMELEVLDYSDYHLLLKIDGKIKDYAYAKTGIDVPDSEKYLSEYSGEFAVLNGTAEEVVLGPFDYDGDEDYPDNAIKTYKFADDAKACTLFTFTQIKDGKVVENTVDYEEISLEEAAYHMEYGGCGLIWFDDELQVSKILLYGATIAEE